MSSEDLFRQAAHNFINENPGFEGRKQAFEILTEVIYGPDEDDTIERVDNATLKQSSNGENNTKLKQPSNGGKEALTISTNKKSIDSRDSKEMSSAVNIIEKEMDDMFDNFASGTIPSTSNMLKRSTTPVSPLVEKKRRKKAKDRNKKR